MNRNYFASYCFQRDEEGERERRSAQCMRSLRQLRKEHIDIKGRALEGTDRAKEISSPPSFKLGI